MLTDVELIQDNTLLLNGSSPYDDPPKVPPVYNDFNTGSRYIDSHYHLKKDDIDFPLGIINFIDGSVYDRGDRLSTEMVAFTISLLNRETRNKPHAWRSLGSIPNFKRVDHKGPDEKTIDYHHIMDKLLEDIRKVQTTTSGVLWPLMFNNKFYMIRLKPYQLCVLGDTPGHNAQVGKYKSPAAKRLCRYCDILKLKLHDPWTTVNLVSRDDVIGWQNNPAALKENCYKKVNNAWNSMCFGGCPYGIHGCVPGEIVHALQLGLIPRVLEGLFITKALTLPEQKQIVDMHVMNENNDLLNDVAVDPDEQTDSTADKIKKGAFGGQNGREVNYISKKLGIEGKHQSNRDMPPLNFSQGITNRSKTTASEQQGIMFLTHLILCSTYAVQTGGIMNRIPHAKFSGYITLMEHLLCFEELLKTT